LLYFGGKVYLIFKVFWLYLPEWLTLFFKKGKKKLFIKSTFNCDIAKVFERGVEKTWGL